MSRHPATRVGLGLEGERLGGPGTSERPNWWSDQTLASADRRPRSHAICARVLPGVQSGTSPVAEATPQADVLRVDRSGDEGSTGTAREGCPGRGAPWYTWLSQSTVCRTEKEWQDAPSGRPAGIEPVCAIPPFQNGRYRHAAGAIDKERFYGESGLNRRIPVHASASNPPSLPDGAVAESAVPICGCPVWPGICSTAVHQAPSPGDHLPPPTGCTSGRVPGRYSDHGRIISGGVAACGQSHSSVAGPRLPGELQQVRAAAGTSGGVSGLPGQFNSHDIRTPHGQGPSDVDNLPELNCPATEYGSTTCQHPGTAVLCSTRDSSHQPAFERPGISAGISPTPASTMGGDRPAMRSSTGGSVLVASAPGGGQRPLYSSASSRPGHADGCSIHSRLGSSLWSSPRIRPLDGGGEAYSYQLPGTTCSLFWSTIAREGPSVCSCDHRNRQPGGCMVHQQNAINHQPGAEQRSPTTVAMVPGERHHHQSRVPARRIECGSRLLVTANGSSTVDTPPGSLSETSQPTCFSSGSGSVCLTHGCPATPICELEARPALVEDRRSQLHMVRPECVPVSSVLSPDEVPEEDSEGGGSSVCVSCPDVERSPMVSPLTEPLCRPTYNAASSPSSTHERAGRRSPSRGSETAAPSRLAAVGRIWQHQQLSADVSSLLSSSWRGGTRKHYDSAWSLWCQWCRQREINPVSPSSGIATVLQYLTDQVSAGKSYRTIGVYRSALSSTLQPMDGHAIGQHPLVSRLMRGIYQQRPPAPRYSATWDPAIPLGTLQSWPPVKDLSLEQHTLKLCFLLAITGAFRASELRHLSADSIGLSPEGVSLQLLALTKTQRSGSLKRVFVARYQVEAVCPVVHLEAYLERTKALRPSGTQQLFISARKPHRAVSAATISHWLVSVLSTAGVDTSVFKGHSTRAAASSTAAGAGLSADEVMRAVGWKQESTFRRFYLRDPRPAASVRIQQEFATRVLAAAVPASTLP